MNKVKQILKVFFTYIIPIAVLLDLLTIGYWEVEYFHEGIKYHSCYVSGFPFPSHGNFTPIQFYNSGEESVNYYYATLNVIILLPISWLLYYYLKKYIFEKTFWRVLIPFIYLLALLQVFFFFGFYGDSYEWFSDFKINNYEFWRP